MTTLREDYIAPENLLLDPNNLRFQDLDGYVSAREDRFNEESVQERAFQRIRRDESLVALKDSIAKNGYVKVERIVVRPYRKTVTGRDGSEEQVDTDPPTFIVIEGNRRVTAVKWLLEDYAAGVDLPKDVLASIQSLPVVIAEEDGLDEVFRASLMGIRHVGGIKEWGGYQRAKLVAHMRDDLSLPPQEVAARTSLTPNEVIRRYRAFKAYKQMEGDDNFGTYAKPKMYPIFHEAVSLPAVKDWLGWDEVDAKFTKQDSLEQFYGLICPTTDEEDQTIDPKITGYQRVRELREILAKPDAKRMLLDPNKTFEDAIAVVKQEELSRLWASDVTSAIRALESIGIQEIKSISTEDLELIIRLKEKAEERIADHEMLTKKAD